MSYGETEFMNECTIVCVRLLSSSFSINWKKRIHC